MPAMSTSALAFAAPAESLGNGARKPGTSATQPQLGPWIRAQALNLARHTQALRNFTRQEFGDGPESPTEGHIQAVNQLLATLRPGLSRRARHLTALAGAARRNPTPDRLTTLVKHKHEAHDWVRRIEKIWDFYFELFGQRQSRFGTWLLSTDRIALDCYQVTYLGIGKVKSVPAPPPFTYMRTGFGPATYRRGIKLTQLGREDNPFPLIQLPYHRMVNPWTLGAVLHEVSHNTQSDLGLSRAVPLAIARALLRAGLGQSLARVWVRWNRETFADLAGLLLGGPCVVASLMDVVGRSPQITYHFNPNGVHPTPYLRVLISVELLRRMGFQAEAEKYARAWTMLYPNPQKAGLPKKLLVTAARAIALVVDAVCYKPFKEIGNKSLADVYRFGQKEQRMVEECARNKPAPTASCPSASSSVRRVSLSITSWPMRRKSRRSFTKNSHGDDMSLEVAFELLRNRLVSLSGEVEELRINATDFFPSVPSDGQPNGEDQSHRAPSPVESLGENALALSGDLREASTALEKGLTAIRAPRNLQQAQASLIDVNCYLNDAAGRCRNDINASMTLQVLSQVAKELGGGWPEWLTLVHTIIRTISDKFLETWQALCQCWEELADKLSSSSVSVQTTNIGQQIAAPTMRETVLEGMT
jgi:hypothetical protein